MLPLPRSSMENQKYTDKTQELQETIKSYNVFETEAESKNRSEILSKLNALVQKWIYETSLQRNKSLSEAKRARAKIFTYGSYRLGAYLKGADIDTLCVAPRHILRYDFFNSFLKLLKQQKEISDLRAVEEAFVPVIKMNFNGIEVDMLFAQLRLLQIPESLDLSDDLLLANLHEKCFRSLNGTRVCHKILSLVPNVENFRITLCVIKLWAKKHGIYSSIVGYLGGVSWAILVAYICLQNPNATVATLVLNFFHVFSRWKWPQPVIVEPGVISLEFLQPTVINNRNLMPIITPVYPRQSVTFSVTQSTRKIMQEKFIQGLLITDAITRGNAKWEKLFEPQNFFTKYKDYIVLLTKSSSAEDQLEWSGLVESKIRHLIGELDKNQNVELAHVNPERFPQLIPTQGEFCAVWFIGLAFKRTSANLDFVFRKFTELVNRPALQTNSYRFGMKLELKQIKKEELHLFVSPDVLMDNNRS